MNIIEYLDESIDALHKLRDSQVTNNIQITADLLVEALYSGKSILVCGNGGSAADAMHITGELVGRFNKERKAHKVICLCSNPAVITSVGNDYSYEQIFARQVQAYGEDGGIIIGLSTSGNSTNVMAAFSMAKSLGLKTIAFTGDSGGMLRDMADVLIAVPHKSTPIIQQLHLCLYHYLCYEVELRLI